MTILNLNNGWCSFMWTQLGGLSINVARAVQKTGQ